jgi:CobQ-like glutamine amidotransferase family enzyme
MRLTVVYLYGELMNLYGDRGNILAIQRRCEWRGIGVELVHVGVGDRIDPGAADLLFFGGGQDVEQATVSRDLMAGNGSAIEEAVDAGAGLLAVCGGYQLLGRFFRTANGVEIPGSGLFDAFTVAGAARLVGNVVAEAEIDGRSETLVGFENHSGRTFVGAAATTAPLARVLVGGGNNGEDGAEGARRGTAIGTYLHGPVLPKNPWLTDWLILAALRRRHQVEILDPLDDTLEIATNRALASRFKREGNVRTSIR